MDLYFGLLALLLVTPGHLVNSSEDFVQELGEDFAKVSSSFTPDPYTTLLHQSIQADTKTSDYHWTNQRNAVQGPLVFIRNGDDSNSEIIILNGTEDRLRDGKDKKTWVVLGLTKEKDLYLPAIAYSIPCDNGPPSFQYDVWQPKRLYDSEVYAFGWDKCLSSIYLPCKPGSKGMDLNTRIIKDYEDDPDKLGNIKENPVDNYFLDLWDEKNERILIGQTIDLVTARENTEPLSNPEILFEEFSSGKFDSEKGKNKVTKAQGRSAAVAGSAGGSGDEHTPEDQPSDAGEGNTTASGDGSAKASGGVKAGLKIGLKIGGGLGGNAKAGPGAGLKIKFGVGGHAGGYAQGGGQGGGYAQGGGHHDGGYPQGDGQGGGYNENGGQAPDYNYQDGTQAGHAGENGYGGWNPFLKVRIGGGAGGNAGAGSDYGNNDYNNGGSGGPNWQNPHASGNAFGNFMTDRRWESAYANPNYNYNQESDNYYKSQGQTPPGKWQGQGQGAHDHGGFGQGIFGALLKGFSNHGPPGNGGFGVRIKAGLGGSSNANGHRPGNGNDYGGTDGTGTGDAGEVYETGGGETYDTQSQTDQSGQGQAYGQGQVKPLIRIKAKIGVGGNMNGSAKSNNSFNFAGNGQMKANPFFNFSFGNPQASGNAFGNFMTDRRQGQGVQGQGGFGGGLKIRLGLGGGTGFKGGAKGNGNYEGSGPGDYEGHTDARGHGQGQFGGGGGIRLRFGGNGNYGGNGHDYESGGSVHGSNWNGSGIIRGQGGAKFGVGLKLGLGGKLGAGIKLKVGAGTKNQSQPHAGNGTEPDSEAKPNTAKRSVEAVKRFVNSKATDVNFFGQVGWLTQNYANTDLVRYNGADGDFDLPFEGFGSCPQVKKTIADLKAASGDDEKITFYLYPLRAQCKVELVQVLVSMLQNGGLELKNEPDSDLQYFTLPDSAKYLDKKLLNEEERRQLYLAYEFSAFTKSYLEYFINNNQPSKYETLREYTGDVELPKREQSKSPYVVFQLYTASLMLEEIGKNHVHCVAMMRRLLLTIKTMFLKTLQDYFRIENCLNCDLAPGDSLRRDLSAILGFFLFIYEKLPAAIQNPKEFGDFSVKNIMRSYSTYVINESKAGTLLTNSLNDYLNIQV